VLVVVMAAGVTRLEDWMGWIGGWKKERSGRIEAWVRSEMGKVMVGAARLYGLDHKSDRRLVLLAGLTRKIGSEEHHQQLGMVRADINQRATRAWSEITRVKRRVLKKSVWHWVIAGSAKSGCAKSGSSSAEHSKQNEPS
jgi:hypothetical protein